MKKYTGKPQWHIILLSLFIGLILIALTAYIYTFYGSLSTVHQRWGEFGAFFSGIITPLTFVTLAFSIYQTKYTTKKTNSLTICTNILLELRSDKFIQTKTKVQTDLPKELGRGLSIRDIQDESLKKAVSEYCHIMNNIGVLVVHNLIDEDVIMSYYGTEILFMYNLLMPFIEKNREQLQDSMENVIFLKNKEYDRTLISSALKYEYAHFEILAKKVRSNGQDIINQFEQYKKNEDRKFEKKKHELTQIAKKLNTCRITHCQPYHESI